MCEPPPKFCGMRSTTRIALDVDCARLPKMSTARGEVAAFKPRPQISTRDARKKRRDYENHHQTDIDRHSNHADRGSAGACSAQVPTREQVLHSRGQRASDQ